MSTEANKETVRRCMEEVFNRGDTAAIPAFIDPAFVDHGAPPGSPGGHAAVAGAVALFAAAFPDWRAEIEDLVAEGDLVAFRGTARGTHRGQFLGVVPTGKRVSVEGIHVFRLARGKIVEHWAQADWLGLLRQLGAIPAPGGPPASR